MKEKMKIFAEPGGGGVRFVSFGQVVSMNNIYLPVM